MISKKFGLSKSTLSTWLKEIPYTPNKEVIDRIGNARMQSATSKHNQMMADIQKMRKVAKDELGKLSKRDLWMLGIGLYIGEGNKAYEQIRLTNSDPKIILLALEWFRTFCNLKEENFRIRIHIYPDIVPDEALKYWSKITGLAEKNFDKIQIDRRTNKVAKKRRTLPFGTIQIVIKSNGKKEFGKSLHRRIMGWIDNSLEQINVRV
jgi:hypothetical protein